MSQQIKDIPASIIGRLTNEQKRTGKTFDEILIYYGIERFLYRLSKTEYRDSFVLKGGLILYSWELPLSRSTRDIDFLGYLENKKEIIDQVIRAAISVSVPEDGIYFDPNTIYIIETQVHADRAGIQAKFCGYLNRTEIRINIDFGFSDELSSTANVTNYPTVLHGMPKPQLFSYPIEAVVAEKFHTMERRASVPSRWKDYYDIWLISEHFEIKAKSLATAILTTFENRSTAIPASRPISLTVEFASKYGKAWRNFLKRSEVENDRINDLSTTVEEIWTFLECPIERILFQKSHRRNETWIPSKRNWK